jgi:hypothetical protein
MKVLNRTGGFWAALGATTLLAVLLEFSGFWQTMLIAGFLGGVLAKKLLNGVAAGFLGVAIAWGLHFVFIWLWTPQSLNIAFHIASTLIYLTVLLGGLLGGLGGAIGALTSALMKTSSEKPEQP